MERMTSKPFARRALWTATIFLLLIALAVVTRRAVELWAPSPSASPFPEAAALDAGFSRHRLLTTLHIFPGLLFLLLGSLQFVKRIRSRRPRLHRWMGRVALASGAVVGVTALVMSPQMATGGVNETTATTFYAIVFLYALGRAFLAIRRGRTALHREWMIRAFAVGLAVAAIRPIVGVFFATSRLTHLTPHDFFGAAFWLGFTSMLLAAEVWINATRPRTRPISL